MKKPGVRDWMRVASWLTLDERERVIKDNEQMVANVKARGLPGEKDFGEFDNLELACKVIPEHVRNVGKFIIRCPHRTDSTIQRKLFVPWSEVEQFVQILPGGYQQYRLGIRQVVEPIWSGTIISSIDSQRIVMELWRGKHLALDDGGNAETSWRGIIDCSLGRPNITWSNGCTDEMKQAMLCALQYLFPRRYPTESLYVEFVLTKEGYQFLGLSTDPFWTKI
ncbi:MAG: hypothetical protein K0S38_837 [Candidatus Paceibacter sp.]|jgi:hypothetical protein|nr:hypothetical protein [Candidatus Paceibacter sp.]